MLRRELAEKLVGRVLAVSEVARIAGKPRKEIEDELQHLLKSVKHRGYTVTIWPAECRQCGFAFDTKRLHKPSKCPKCQGTWILEPSVEIQREGER